MQVISRIPAVLSLLLLSAWLLGPVTQSVAPAYATDFSVFASQWDTEDLGEAVGVGVRFSWLFTQNSMLDVGASFFEELDEGVDISSLSDLDSARLAEDGVQTIPIDVGLRWGPRGLYVGGGVTYFMLDGPNSLNIDDEYGYYGVLGYQFGNRRSGGLGFFIEAKYRQVEGTLESDVEDLGDIDDIDLVDGFDLDLGGLNYSVGLTFQF